MAAGAKILSAVLKFSIVIDHIDKFKIQRFFFLAASASEIFDKYKVKICMRNLVLCTVWLDIIIGWGILTNVFNIIQRFNSEFTYLISILDKNHCI